jgi:hypothetical protein
MYVQIKDASEKPEWNLDGQAIPLTLPITDPPRIFLSSSFYSYDFLFV